MVSSKRQGQTGMQPAALFRGKVIKVIHKDQTAAKQTLVDINMFDLQPALYNVPIAASKSNSKNGEDTTPEIGDMVLVAYIGGNPKDPVVIMFLPTYNNPHQATAAEAPHSKKTRSGSSETIKKDGTREVTIAKDDILVVKGSGTIRYEGAALALDVTTGTATITVHGNAKIESAANVEVKAAGEAKVHGATVQVLSDTGAMTINSAAAMTVHSTGNMAVTSGGTCTVSGTGTTNVSSTGNLNVTGTGTVTVTAANIALNG